MPSLIATLDLDTNKYDPSSPHKIRVPWRIKRVGGVEIHGRWARVRLFGERGETGHQYYPRERAAEAQAFVDTFRGIQAQRVRSVAEVVTEYAEHLRTIGGSKGKPLKSWQHKRGILEAILGLVDPAARKANRGKRRPQEYTYQDRPLSELTVREAQRLYLARTKLVSPDSHHQELIYAQKFSDFCVERGYLAVNPFADVRPMGEKSVGKEQLTIDESEKFISVALADGHLASFAAASALMMGVRSSELLLRSVRDLDANGTILRIPLGARKVKSKHSARAVYIPAQLQATFKTLADAASKGLMDPKQTGPTARLFGTLHVNTLLKRVKKLCATAGVPVVCTHGLRGSYTSNEVESGVPVKVVSQKVGHGSLGVTRTNYLRPGAEQTQRARMWESRMTGDSGDNTPEPTAKEQVQLGTKEEPVSPARPQLALVP